MGWPSAVELAEDKRKPATNALAVVSRGAERMVKGPVAYRLMIERTGWQMSYPTFHRLLLSGRIPSERPSPQLLLVKMSDVDKFISRVREGDDF